MTYTYHVKLHDGPLLYAEHVETEDEAIKSLGLTRAEVKRTMPIKCWDTVKVMSEETKEYLRNLNAERKALRNREGERI